jgi:hypothetical protein
MISFRSCLLGQQRGGVLFWKYRLRNCAYFSKDNSAMFPQIINQAALMSRVYLENVKGEFFLPLRQVYIHQFCFIYRCIYAHAYKAFSYILTVILTLMFDCWSFEHVTKMLITKKTPWSEYTNKLYRPSDLRLSAKWLSTFADRGCHVISLTDPYGRILDILNRSLYFSIK